MYMYHFYIIAVCLRHTQQIPYAASGLRSTCKHKTPFYSHKTWINAKFIAQNANHTSLICKHSHTGYKSYPKWNECIDMYITIERLHRSFTWMLWTNHNVWYDEAQWNMHDTKKKRETTVKWCTLKSRNCGRLSFPSFLLCWHSNWFRATQSVYDFFFSEPPPNKYLRFFMLSNWIWCDGVAELMRSIRALSAIRYQNPYDSHKLDQPFYFTL